MSSCGNSTKRVGILFVVLLLLITTSDAARASRDDKEEKGAIAVLWRDPGNIRDRDLWYGPGSKHLAPAPPFQFIEEDKGGTSPKFEVKDSRGVTWVVKLGEEAAAETVATRLVWAVGYFAEEAYYFDRITVKDLPKLSRGNQFVTGEVVQGVRLEPRRSHVHRGPRWDWENNRFAGTRELDGLKVIMVLLNNYDIRPENNRIFYVNNRGRKEAQYVVTDLGATLGRPGGLGGRRSKNNLSDYLSTKFVRGVDDGAVKFDYSTRPSGLGMLSIVHVPYYLSQVKKERVVQGIPVAHARWMGSLLAQLSERQLEDSFRSAGYDQRTRRAYVRELLRRINQLTALQPSADLRAEH